MLLLPRPEFCLPEIRRFFDLAGEGVDDFSDSHVIVLPYAEVPDESLAELEAVATMGATVHYPNPATDIGWPKLSRRHPANHDFNVALVKQLQEHLRPLLAAPTQSPSDFIKQLAVEFDFLLIADGALEMSDKVAPHRHDFIRRAVTALVDAVSEGLSGRFDAHCQARGLQHAQSGGSTFTVSVQGGQTQHADIVCQTHLKQGDRTTKEAAVRVYYTFIDDGGRRYAALLYVGPHPEGNYARKVQLQG